MNRFRQADAVMIDNIYVCPVCNTEKIKFKHCKFCLRCGQYLRIVNKEMGREQERRSVTPKNQEGKDQVLKVHYDDVGGYCCPTCLGIGKSREPLDYCPMCGQRIMFV